MGVGMNLDFGDVLSRAWQITWQHKVLWFLTALPISIILLVLPFMFIPLLSERQDPREFPNVFGDPISVLILIFAFMVIFVGSILLQIVARSSVTLGVLRAEAEIQPVTFTNLLKDGFQYFWRILGVFALVNVTFGLVFSAFFAGVMALILVTVGIAAVCLQPLFILITPLSLLVLALMEQAEAAVVANGMGVMEAVKQAYELVRANIWKYILITVVIYFGMTTLISLVIFLFMIPFSAFVFSSLNSEAGSQNLVWLLIAFTLLLTAVIALVQGVALTYMKSALMIIYLRLTRSPTLQPLLQEAAV
jgi:hypothetical protein